MTVPLAKDQPKLRANTESNSELFRINGAKAYVEAEFADGVRRLDTHEKFKIRGHQAV
jgi:hypothetical protein